MIYEYRAYTCFPGRLPALVDRFESVTFAFWETYGIRPAGFWTTEIGESNQVLHYLLEWESMAERELSLNLTDDAKDILVDKGWDPAMGARPLRRAIQRYIEDPLADEVLRSNLDPGSTVEVDRKPPGEGDEGKDPEVEITITAPTKKRQPVGVGAKGEAAEGESTDTPVLDAGSGDLPDAPDVLPEVPDAPPSAEAEPEPGKD